MESGKWKVESLELRDEKNSELQNLSPELINIRLNDDGTAVIIIDQTLLPGETRYITLREAGELHEAIYMLRVRGAPAIGIFAAFALYVLARNSGAGNYESFRDEILKQSAYLNTARPTAVNLDKQLKRMERIVLGMSGTPVPQVIDAMLCEAEEILREDIEMCRAISEYGLTLIGDGDGVMTYCNAGPLATSRYGTALGPILLAHERGVRLNVYSCETRPLLQGARLTSYELDRAGIGCTLICDNMASIVMSEGKISAVFAGCDRLARNGDAANKVGTGGLAILAKHYGVPFYIFCPSSTYDKDCATGRDIEIELREPDEIKKLHYSRQVAPDGVNCYNPAFDVADNKLITAIITEKGICRAPYTESLTRLAE